MNKFKLVNDNLGHKAGDELLMMVSEVIIQQTRQCDVAARFGGDEFIIVMENTQSCDGEEVAHRIHQAILSQVPTAVLDLGFGVSIGVVTSGTQKETLSDLIHKADTSTVPSGRDS